MSYRVTDALSREKRETFALPPRYMHRQFTIYIWEEYSHPPLMPGVVFHRNVAEGLRLRRGPTHGLRLLPGPDVDRPDPAPLSEFVELKVESARNNRALISPLPAFGALGAAGPPIANTPVYADVPRTIFDIRRLPYGSLCSNVVAAGVGALPPMGAAPARPYDGNLVTVYQPPPIGNAPPRGLQDPRGDPRALASQVMLVDTNDRIASVFMPTAAAVAAADATQPALARRDPFQWYLSFHNFGQQLVRYDAFDRMTGGGANNRYHSKISEVMDLLLFRKVR